jgi:hypothetical protein
VFDGVTSLHFGGGRQPYLLLPVIPLPRSKPQTRRRPAKR